MPTRVRFIGDKEFHIDSLFKTKKVWHGRGDVQIIANDELAKKMVKFCPGTYELAVVASESPDRTVDPKAAGLEEVSDPMLKLRIVEPALNDLVPAREASRAALVKYADSEGIYVSDNRTREEILQDLEIALGNSDKMQVAEELRDKEESATAQEATFYQELVKFLTEDESTKKPTVAACKKFPFKFSGVKFLNAKMRDKAWSDSRLLREQREFERIQLELKKEPAPTAPEPAETA